MGLSRPDNPSNPYIIPVLAMHGELDTFLAEGWDLAWMTDQHNLDRAAIFHSDTAGDVYREILYYHRDNGIVPTRDRIEAGYPTAPIPWDTEITATEVLTEARRSLRTVHTQMFLGDLQGFLETYDGKSLGRRAVEVDDIQAVSTLTENYLRKIQASSPAILPFRLLSLEDIENLPDPEILIDGLVDHGTVTKLVGESGKGKSFVAIDWSLCIATGRRWQGRKVRKGRVLYISAEGALGFRKRIPAWQKINGDVPAGSFVLIPDAVQLSDAGQLQALIKVAKDFDVVVIDTLARTSAGLEENSARDMGLYINNAYKIRDSAREAGATVLIVHHTGYDKKRARGSSALFANGDGEILIESDDPHEAMTMTVKKRKDGEAGHQFYMHLETVDCGDWTSCVVQGMDAPEVELTPRERLLEALTGEDQTTRELEIATGLPNTTVDRELRAMVGAGLAVSSKGHRNANVYRRS